MRVKPVVTLPVDRATLGTLDAVRLAQFRDALSAALGVDDPTTAFEIGERDGLAWQYARFTVDGEPGRTYDEWQLGGYANGQFVPESATLYVADSTDRTGVTMVQCGYGAETDDPEALELLSALNEVP
jgi:hypothetical protein